MTLGITSPLLSEGCLFPPPRSLLLSSQLPFPILSSEDPSPALLYKVPRQRCFLLQTAFHLFQIDPSP